jgi:hypothetical protein
MTLQEFILGTPEGYRCVIAITGDRLMVTGYALVHPQNAVSYADYLGAEGLGGRLGWVWDRKGHFHHQAIGTTVSLTAEYYHPERELPEPCRSFLARLDDPSVS